MLLKGRKVQLKIYYLFILADGECTADENEKFLSICKAMGIDDDDKNEIVSFCENAVHTTSNDNSAKVISEIAKLLVDSARGSASSGTINRDKSMQIETIWNLINLAYADTEYSEAEKKIVSFLTDFWEIDPLALSDLYDTAETILALTRQKEWLKTSGKTYDTIFEAITEIDEAIARMANYLEILVSEAYIT